ncbi:MAG: porin [Planctomycetota bacterium]|nr:MAG: porin [Planctomycetota bacterium]
MTFASILRAFGFDRELTPARLALLLLAAALANSPLTAQDSAPAPFPPPAPPSNLSTSAEPILLFDEPEADDAVTARLNEIDEKLAALDEAQKALADKTAKGIVFPGTRNNTVQLNGRIHADYWAFPGSDAGIDAFEGTDPQDRFIFRRMRFGVKGDIRDNMEYKIEMEFAEGAEPQYRDVYIGFNDLPVLQTVLIGNQKRPYGLDHLNSSRYNIFIERPFIIEAFNQDARRLGIVSYGVSDDEAWNWRYGVYNMELTQNDAGYIGDHYQLEGAGRLANTWWYDESSDGRGYAHWAVSGTIAHPDGDGGTVIAPGPPTVRVHQNEARFRTRPEARSTSRWLNTGRIAGAQWYELLGLEKVVNVGPLQVVGELQNVWLQRSAAAGDDLWFWGGYAYVAYMLTGEHVPWERDGGVLGRVKPFENFFLVNRASGGHGGGWGAWQIAARYSYADLSDGGINGGVGNSLTLGMNWYWNPNARLQFNYIHGWIDDHAPVNGFTEGEYDIIGARAMVDF